MIVESSTGTAHLGFRALFGFKDLLRVQGLGAKPGRLGGRHLRLPVGVGWGPEV